MIVKRITPLWQDPALYLPIAYLCLSFPLFALRRDFSGEVVGEVNFTALMLSYCILGLAAILMCRHRSVLNNLFVPVDLIFFAFAAVVMLSVFAQGNLDPFIRIAALLVVVLGIRVASMSSRFFTGLQIASLALLVFLIAAVIILGPPIHRRLGGIHPNAFGGVALSCAFLATFGPQRRFEITAAICLACATLVSSRYSMVGICLLYSTYWLLNIRRAGFVRVALAAAALFLLAADFLLSANYGVLGEALDLNSSKRGLASGLSGRDGQWADFPYQFEQKPLFGFGFRNRTYAGTHNAFMNLTLENGILGTFPILSFIILRFITIAREALKTPKTEIRGRYLAGMIAITFGAMLQPQILNFGDAFGYTTLLLLFAAPGSERAGAANAVSIRLRFRRSRPAAGFVRSAYPS